MQANLVKYCDEVREDCDVRHKKLRLRKCKAGEDIEQSERLFRIRYIACDPIMQLVTGNT